MNKASIERIYKKLASCVAVPERGLIIHAMSAMVMHGYEEKDNGLELLATSGSSAALKTHVGAKKKVTITGIRYYMEVDGLEVVILPMPCCFLEKGYSVDMINGCQVVTKRDLFRYKIERLRGNFTDRYQDEKHLMLLAEPALV